MGNVYIGTSGWSYKSWDKAFYPREISKARQFEFYVTHRGDQQYVLSVADIEYGSRLAGQSAAGICVCREG